MLPNLRHLRRYVLEVKKTCSVKLCIVYCPLLLKLLLNLVKRGGDSVTLHHAQNKVLGWSAKVIWYIKALWMAKSAVVI